MDARPINPLVVIVGPTASGKTSLAIDLAEKYNGEIICADSRTVYKGMDIGTAKPSHEELRRVPHWGLDLVEPNQNFTASDFKQYADDKIANIRQRGRVPFLVGGTGLYIDAVVFNFQFGAKADSAQRRYLEGLSTQDLLEYCKSNEIKIPVNDNNRRHIIRAIERQGVTPRRDKTPVARTIVVGIATDRAILRDRIATRSEQIFSQPIVDEANVLGEKYGWDSEAMTGNIYPLLRSYARKESRLGDVKERFVALDWNLAKRQLTWLRRNPYIVWLSKEEVDQYLRKMLATR